MKNDDDNIPEVILNKDDPLPYYDKELKVWMIPGQEEEIKKMLTEQKKPPPIGKSKKAENLANPNNTKTEKVDNYLVNPRKQYPLSKKPGGKMPSNRYASVFSESSINNVGNKEEINDNKNESDKQHEIANSNENLKKDKNEKNNLTMFKPNKSTKSVNDIKNDETQNELIQLRENTTEIQLEQINHEIKDSKEFDLNIHTIPKNKNQENTLYVKFYYFFFMFIK
jgi:hypothetical protein